MDLVKLGSVTTKTRSHLTLILTSYSHRRHVVGVDTGNR